MITVPVPSNMYQTVVANISSIQAQGADGTLQVKSVHKNQDTNGKHYQLFNCFQSASFCRTLNLNLLEFLIQKSIHAVILKKNLCFIILFIVFRACYLLYVIKKIHTEVGEVCNYYFL